MKTLILGGPGCGKTTKLMSIIDKVLSSGIAPERIAFLTFTKKAAREAIDRACAKFKFDREEIPFFRTIHSFAFTQLGLTPSSVMSDELHTQFGKWAGHDLTSNNDENMGISMRTEDDRLMTAISLARLTRRPLERVCEDLMVPHRMAKAMQADFTVFKYERGVLDFTDMLETWVERGNPPPIDILIVDEAQDLCRLQWEIVEKLSPVADEVYYAGDDDQAIYGWAGADVEYFLNLQGKKMVLPTSYRLRRNVFDVSQRLVSGIEDRYAKDWAPHSEGGVVSHVQDIHNVDIGNGSWYLLARNAYLLNSWKAFLYMKGVPFIDGDRSTIDNDEVKSIIVWEHLRRGEKLGGARISLLWENLNRAYIDKDNRKALFDVQEEYNMQDLTSSFGLLSTDDWTHAIDVPPHTQKYYREIKHRGESLTKTPRVTVSTIHGAKGGEADNVLLHSDMSRKTFNHLQEDKASELRVFFVGASRAKESLYIQEPRTPEHIRIH